jgi:hypothetical protein
VPLKAIFNFHGDAPLWASAPAQVVGHLDGTDVPVDVLGQAPQNTGLGVVCFAESPEDIIRWLKHVDSTPPILIPTHLCGPDVMTRFKIRIKSYQMTTFTIEVIGMGQLKSYTVGNKTSLGADIMTDALNSLNENHWFEKMKKDAPNWRQKLIDELKNHTIFRFLGGYHYLLILIQKPCLSNRPFVHLAQMFLWLQLICMHSRLSSSQTMNLGMFSPPWTMLLISSKSKRVHNSYLVSTSTDSPLT